MGYQTDFDGRFEFNKPLSDEMYTYLDKFNTTRRMARHLDPIYGVQGEFYVDGKGSFGQDREIDIINYNKPPSTQPGLWCQWRPTDDRKGLEWDQGEKFYRHHEWVVYLIHKILAPAGYVLNGNVRWIGESSGDSGTIIIKDNIVYSKPTMSQTEQLVEYAMFDQVTFAVEQALLS